VVDPGGVTGADPMVGAVVVLMAGAVAPTVGALIPMATVVSSSRPRPSPLRPHRASLN